MLCPLDLSEEGDLEVQISMAEEAAQSGPLALLAAAPAIDVAAVVEAARPLAAVPLIIDLSAVEDVPAVLNEVVASGAGDRVACAGLSVATPLSVWAEVQGAGIRAAVLSSVNPPDRSLKGRVYALESGGNVIDEGLLDRAERHGITMPLVDLGGPGPGGSGLRALLVAKSKWGLPCGCDLREAVGGARDRGATLTAAAMAQAMGADFVYTGPPEDWGRTARALAFADSLMAQAAAEM